MANLKIKEIRFTVDEYIKYSYFNNLYEYFIEMMDIKDNNVYSSVNKYLLASVVACIEGNVYINFQKKSWYFWSLGKNEIVNNCCSNSYLLLSIYDYVKSNKDSFDFITNYFNLWHANKNQEFVYDKFHKKELNENFLQLICIIKEDIKTAINRSDIYVIEILCKLYDMLTNTSRKIIYS